MAAGQLYYNVRFADGSYGSGTFPDGASITANNFFGENNDLVTRIGHALTKVGIQAPPGTQIVFNGDHTITIGRTGVFEIEAKITNMYIVRVSNYVHLNTYNPDEEKSYKEQKMKISGATAMQNAVRTYWLGFLQSVTIPAEDASQAAWDKFDSDLKQYRVPFEADYAAGLANYLTGLNGIYEIGDPPYVDVQNIIIDYQYDS